MMGRTHRPLGVATWFTLAALLVATDWIVLDVWQVLAGAIIAEATSSGPKSPDADGHPILARLIPGGHRGPLHMPDLVALVGALLLWLSGDSPAHFAVAAVVCGWLTHLLLGDLPFGGVPWAVLWLVFRDGRRHGLKLRTDGWFERTLVRRAMLPLSWVAGTAAVAATTGAWPVLVDTAAQAWSLYQSARDALPAPPA